MIRGVLRGEGGGVSTDHDTIAQDGPRRGRGCRQERSGSESPRTAKEQRVLQLMTKPVQWVLSLNDVLSGYSTAEPRMPR